MRVTYDHHLCGEDDHTPGIDFGRTRKLWDRTMAHFVFKAGGGSHFVSRGEQGYSELRFYVCARERTASIEGIKHEVAGCTRYEGERLIDFAITKPSQYLGRRVG